MAKAEAGTFKVGVFVFEYCVSSTTVSDLFLVIFPGLLFDATEAYDDDDSPVCLDEFVDL